MTLGPYEITRDGRTYHGNVRLKEHHLVAREGRYCLFLVPDMTAAPVGPAVAAALARLMPGFADLVPDALMQTLRGCGLEAGEGDTDGAGNGDGAADEDAAAAATFPVLTVALFLAQTCNLRCTYCYGEGGEYGGGGVMEEETAFAAVDWLLENALAEQTVHISFFGGEPLLSFTLLRRVVTYAKAEAAARGKEVRFGITTNASLLTDEIIAYLVEEEVEPLVSFDGPAEIHDRQRPFRNGRGSYRRVHANVQKLRAAMPKLAGRATVCAGSDPFAVRRGLEAAGFTSCFLTPASPVILNGAGVKDLEAEAAERQLRERMLVYRRSEAVELFAAVRERRLDGDATPGATALLTTLARGRRRHAGCGIGRGMRAVAVDGSVYPCHRFVGFEEARMGDLGSCRAGEINDYHRAVVENLPVCRTCWARHLCGGGCFYENLARIGDMHRPDPLFCREMKAVCEDLIAGWCALGEDDRAYLREQAARPDVAPRP